MIGQTARCCLSIGVFDGVHLGHNAILKRLREESQRTGLASAVVTFRPHPDEVIRGERILYLCSWQERCRLMMEQGVQWLETVHFSKRIAAKTAEEFFTQELPGRLSPVSLVVGHDFRMGRGREGSHGELRQLGKRLGFQVSVIDPVTVRGEVVSSTTIRSALSSGDVERAAELLGRNFLIEGEVVRGVGRGAKLKFPTANLAVEETALLPANGVYIVQCEVGGQMESGVANVGVKPTFGGGPRAVEVHILDFRRNIVGEHVRAYFVRRLRAERSFRSVEALVAQMKEDVREAASVLESQGGGRS